MLVKYSDTKKGYFEILKQFLVLYSQVILDLKMKYSVQNEIKLAYICYMEFEWDINKNKINKEKHNFSFEEAVKVFEDINNYIEKTNQLDEARYKIIGIIYEKLFTVVYTIRNSITRIISARRANNQEEKKYNEKNKGNEKNAY